MQCSKIVVGVDFSEITDSVINSALSFAKLFNTEVHLIHVIEPPIIAIYENPFLELDNTEVVLELEEILKKKFSESLQKYTTIFENSNIPVKTVVEVGNIAETILEYLDKVNADLLIVGSHKRGLIEKFLVGSIAEKLLNKSKNSILVVKGKGLKEIKRVLCGYDFLPNSQRAVEVAVEIANKTGAEVEVLHADYDEWFSHLKDVYKEVFKKKTKLLEDLKKEIKAKYGVEVEVKIEKGKPEKILKKEIENFKPDLTILGKRKSTEIKRMFIGTVAMKIVKNSPTPILVIKKKNN